jgi:sugar/nucleoside kinase (ribokinase family)
LDELMTGLLITVGEILVEIMATTVGTGFRTPQNLVGPFPSGAPAIFIDQAGRLGAPCAMIGAVGDDDFGRVNLDRLSADGVDVSAVAVHSDIATGSAFVRYRADGNRDFVFNIRHSASGRIAMTPRAEHVIARASRIHVMGSALAIPSARIMVERAVATIKANGGLVSFDPNVRKEMMNDAALTSALHSILAATDLFLPSGDEILLFSQASDEQEAARRLVSNGVKEIALKRGGGGALVTDAAGTLGARAFKVVEVDPTGAGDCFGATYVVCRDRGMPIEKALAYANAAGARAVTVRGPMEGASTFADLDSFIARAEGTA